jgi:hypothetical protein
LEATILADPLLLQSIARGGLLTPLMPSVFGSPFRLGLPSTPLVPGKRDVLACLTSDELLTIVDRFELEVADRRVKDQLVDVVAASKRATSYCRSCHP